MRQQLAEPSTQRLKELLDKARHAEATHTTEKLDIEGYENVYHIKDPQAKLTALIAIHDTTLGPALGGTRIYPYASFEAGLQDVLRLAEGMTYKSAVAGVGFGGGKSVIFADPKTDKTEKLLLSFGRAIEELEGQYICAEDIGCTVDDVNVIHRATQYVTGLSHAKSSGNPSHFTAWGVFRGIQATVAQVFGSPSLEGKTVAIQGVGSVGALLAELLFWAGAKLVFADLYEERARNLADRYGAQVVGYEEIYDSECDVFAPCAIGGILNSDTIARLKCRVVAGGANNQLLKVSHADDLYHRKICYAPDFIINAGGLLNVSSELESEGYNPQSVRAKTHSIYDTLTAVYEISEKSGTSTHEAALSLADYRIRYGIGRRLTPPVFHHSIGTS